MTKLFLDDERNPGDVTWIRLPAGPYDVVRSYFEFKQYIQDNGIPEFISFDHDLADSTLDGMLCAKFLVSYIMDYDVQWNGLYAVHSKNPVGAASIRGYLEGFKKAYQL